MQTDDDNPDEFPLVDAQEAWRQVSKAAGLADAVLLDHRYEPTPVEDPDRPPIHGHRRDVLVLMRQDPGDSSRLRESLQDALDGVSGQTTDPINLHLEVSPVGWALHQRLQKLEQRS